MVNPGFSRLDELQSRRAYPMKNKRRENVSKLVDQIAEIQTRCRAKASKLSNPLLFGLKFWIDTQSGQDWLSLECREDPPDGRPEKHPGVNWKGWTEGSQMPSSCNSLHLSLVREDSTNALQDSRRVATAFGEYQISSVHDDVLLSGEPLNLASRSTFDEPGKT
jgi:hypothetical protein